MRSLNAARCRLMTALVVGAALASCALVPRESVELSTSVGREVSVMHEAHRELAVILFDRMKKDVNRFVDTVYAPHQIQFVLARQKERQRAGDAINLFSVLEKSMNEPENASAQSDVLAVLGATVELVEDDIKRYRQERLAPILDAEKSTLDELNRAYDRVERGNAIVTAHLASVVKVNEAQDELLSTLKLEGLREKTGSSLSAASTRIADFVNKARKFEGTVDETERTIRDLTIKLDSLVAGE
jgi:hypothetical protein